MVFHLVNGVRTSGVEMICEMDFVRYVIQEIHAFMILIRILSTILPTLTTFHTPHMRLTRVILVETILILFPVIHPPPQETSIEILHDQKNKINFVETFLRKFNRYSFFETPKVLLRAWDRVFKIKDALGNKQNKPEDTQELFRELFNDVQNIHDELAEYINTPGWNRLAFYNNGDDDDEDCTIAITSDFLIMDSLSMGDEHLDTIPEKESDEFNKSGIEDLIPNPSEFEDECKCDVPDCDDSQMTIFSTFSNPLFDDSTSSDDESSHEEAIHEMSFKTYSNPLFYLNEKIISKFVFENSNANIEYIFPSPIPNEDSDSLMEEIDLFLTPDDPMPPSIEDDDYGSERDILIHEELLDNYSLSLPVIESFHFDISSFSRPPAKPPGGNTRILNIKMMGDNSEQKPSAKYPMMIHGKNIPILDVSLFHFYPLDQFKYGGISIPENVKTLAIGFYPPSLHFLSFNWESCIQILSTNVLSFGTPNKWP
nr:hypothetical protein [Tanacetum cinerariifolium]